MHFAPSAEQLRTPGGLQAPWLADAVLHEEKWLPCHMDTRDAAAARKW